MVDITKRVSDSTGIAAAVVASKADAEAALGAPAMQIGGTTTVPIYETNKAGSVVGTQYDLTTSWTTAPKASPNA